MGCSSCGKKWRRSAVVRRSQRPFIDRSRKVQEKKTPQVAKQQLKGEPTTEKCPEVDASTGYAKELIKTGKIAGPTVDNPVATETVTVENKVPTIQA